MPRKESQERLKYYTSRLIVRTSKTFQVLHGLQVLAELDLRARLANCPRAMPRPSVEAAKAKEAKKLEEADRIAKMAKEQEDAKAEAPAAPTSKVVSPLRVAQAAAKEKWGSVRHWSLIE